MRDRFTLDQQQNILFINFAGLRIESREQVDAMAQYVREAYETQGRRVYAVVNYEGTEIAPEIVDYYGERIKDFSDRYGIATARYSSSGFTRSVLRYLGAASDLQSNVFATRGEAIRAIQEIETRRRAESSQAVRRLLNPRRSVLGRLLIGWLVALLVLATVCFVTLQSAPDSQSARAILLITVSAALLLIATSFVTSAVLFFRVIKPLRRMEGIARQLVTGGYVEPVTAGGPDEVGSLARALNETAEQLRRDLERLSGLYHISLMMGTGTEVSRACELLTRKIARLLGAEMCLILLCDERKQRLSAQLPGYGVSDDQAQLLRSRLDECGIVASVLKTGEPYLTNDAAAEMPGVREMLAVPLQAGELTLGSLAVMNKAGGFLEEDKQLVMIFASQAAHLLANAQLLEKERLMTQQLIASERLAAVGELVAGVAHEVRNPLFGIMTTLGALSRKLDDREAVRPFLDVVNMEVGHLNYLMEQLLEHSRPITFDATASDIREVIREAIAEFRPQAEAGGVTLSCDCPEQVPALRFDRRKMHGVFVNLLDNALRHTKANGQIWIVLSMRSDNSNGDGQSQLRIEVSDTGSGIVPENVSRVFEPFFTTRTDGTGLGLAITRKTIHDHGGTIAVRSETGKGTSFMIRLPLQAQSP